VAASGLFAALVLGVWWTRTTATGAVAGMVAGFAVCIWYTFGTEYYGVPLLFKGTALTEKGLSNLSAGVIGIPVSFLVTIVVSLMTKAPSREMQGFVESIRIPRGGVIMKEARQVE
jgi:cation/acetate symporter